MGASTTSENGGVSPPKRKAACDQCNASKVRCSGGGLPCKRCADSSKPCHYSLAKRIGKPRGIKNRKTLERLRQAEEADLENNNRRGGESSIHQISDDRNDGDGALNDEKKHRPDDDSLDPLQTSSTTSFWPVSPIINYPVFRDPSLFILNPDQVFHTGDHNVSFDDSDRSALYSAEPEFPDFEGFGSVESPRPWPDARDDCWDYSSPSIDEQFSLGPADSDSPLSEVSLSSMFGTGKPISLDTVTARLEEAAGPTITHFEQRKQTLCQCLREYADVLCKLQTIEKRQRPVQVDTLLTCANLVLNITENQLKCTQCLYDSCVAMQLVMVFQTIFTWSQGQCQSPQTPGTDLRVTLGQHEMTEEERSFVKTALMSKALDRTGALLRSMMSRIERVTVDRGGKQSWDHEGGELWNLQQLVSSLVQSFGSLSKRLASGAVEE